MSKPSSAPLALSINRAASVPESDPRGGRQREFADATYLRILGWEKGAGQSGGVHNHNEDVQRVSEGERQQRRCADNSAV